MMEVKKKGLISEEDVSLILRRYTATTILALLQEVAQFPEVKMDWNALVKKTSTGISSAREYQMLWRHLAYRHSMVEKLEEGSEPLDDDSDLEFEVETFPAVSNESSTEAAACVKVLIASAMPGDSVAPNSTLEAPLTINIPNTSQALGNHSGSKHPASARPIQGVNITIPVSVQKQPLPAAPCGELLEGNGTMASGQTARRKRKLWTEDEDKELIAAVQKCGEGNWANILKGDFKHDRTASQLSQRWAIIRKRQANSNLTAVGNSTSSGLSDAQLATRQAVSMALNMSMSNSIPSMSSFGAALNSSTQPATPAAVAPVSAQQSEPGVKLEATQQALLPSPQAGVQRSVPSQTAKVKPAPKKSSAQPKTSSGPTPNPLVQAAAVAAGARIGTASDAASLYNAGQCRNTVHVRPGGVPLAKPIPPGPKASSLSATVPRPSNVHYIRTGLTSTPPVYSGSLTSVQRSAGGSGRVAPVSPSSTLCVPSTSSAPPNQTLSEIPKSSIIPNNTSSGTSGAEFMSQDVGDRNAAGGKLESSSEELRISPLEQSCLPTTESTENQPVSEDSNVGKISEEKVVAGIVNHEVENGEKHLQNADS